MASKRMFSVDVIDTDNFLDMPVSSQALYFHFGMRADDDGFVSSPKKIVKIANCTNDDLRVLISKGYVIPFESGVIVITDWKTNNLIKTDRYKKTRYQEEFKQLELHDGAYTKKTNNLSCADLCRTECIQDGTKMEPNWNQDGTQVEPQVRLGKDSIDKDNIYIVEQGSTKYPFKEIIEHLNRKSGKNYRYSSKATQKHIKARIKEGFTLEDFKRVIDWKVSKWIGTDMEQYLRPETLFGTKFESYLNEAPAARAAEPVAQEKSADPVDYSNVKREW